MIEIDIHKRLQTPGGHMELDVQLKISKGQLVTLYGPSGAGKTSILRILSGLLQPDGGKITVHDKIWLHTENKICLTPQQRTIGYMFQDYGLFPNMTVLQNLEFAFDNNPDNNRIEELIHIMELDGLQYQNPKTLSGGQQQRVALARTLIQPPEVLLLDEPLSALDAVMRIKLQNYILKIQKDYQLTTILVSHDIGEVVKMSDHIFCIDKGKIERQGNAEELFIHANANNDFKLIGEVIDIQKNSTIFNIKILVGINIINVQLEESLTKTLHIGDKVTITSSVFSPTIQRV